MFLRAVSGAPTPTRRERHDAELPETWPTGM
jgi:hypothetical protein